MEIKIEAMKKLLTATAEKYNFDFQHLEVMKTSQLFDILIVNKMRKREAAIMQ
jgi:hypothetical protein